MPGPGRASSDQQCPPAYESTKKSLQFWLVLLGTGMAVFLSALELSCVGTALPTIVHDLKGGDFVWVGSAYALTSAAFMPTAGGLSNIFGRRAVMLSCIAFFTAGAALAGSAHSINSLIAARAVQGTGGGGIIALTEIIIADLVPLRERGKYSGIIAAVWALASVIGPLIGGQLASSGHWRWLFYMNLPLAAIAAFLVFLFLRMRQPPAHWREKLHRIDWGGNGIIISSTALTILSLTWAGVRYPWASCHVLVPLIVGLLGIFSFVLYEAFIPSEPTIPLRLWSKRTALSGYAVAFFHGMVSTMLIYYFPTYFQGAKGTSAIRSAVLLFPTACLVAPSAIASGRSIERSGAYLLQNYTGWALIMIGFGTLSLLKSTSSTAMAEGLQIVGAIGLGIMYNAPNFLVLAPVAVEDNAQALALMVWFQTFGQTFGITVGATILQNSLQSTLPLALLSAFPGATDISYSLIPSVPSIPEPLRSQVKGAFATSISHIWLACVGLAGLGLLCLLPAKAIPLRLHLDEHWGLDVSRLEPHLNDVELAPTKPADSGIEPNTKANDPPQEPHDSNLEIIATSQSVERLQAL